MAEPRREHRTLRLRTLNTWRAAAAVLLSVAAAGAIVRSIDASFIPRFAGVLAAASMAWVAYGIYRARTWALGAGFFIAIFWFWATLALRVQSAIGAGEFIVWIAWAVAVMVATVRARPS